MSIFYIHKADLNPTQNLYTTSSMYIYIYIYLGDFCAPVPSLGRLLHTLSCGVLQMGTVWKPRGSRRGAGGPAVGGGGPRLPPDPQG